MIIVITEALKFAKINNNEKEDVSLGYAHPYCATILVALTLHVFHDMGALLKNLYINQSGC